MASFIVELSGASNAEVVELKIAASGRIFASVAAEAIKLGLAATRVTPGGANVGEVVLGTAGTGGVTDGCSMPLVVPALNLPGSRFVVNR